MWTSADSTENGAIAVIRALIAFQVSSITDQRLGIDSRGCSGRWRRAPRTDPLLPPHTRAREALRVDFGALVTCTRRAVRAGGAEHSLAAAHVPPTRRTRATFYTSLCYPLFSIAS